MEEGALARAWRDLKNLLMRSWRFQVVLGLIVVTNSVVSALRYDGETAAAVAVGMLGVPGMVLFVCIWTFGLLVLIAPIRQRNEARAELHRLTTED